MLTEKIQTRIIIIFIVIGAFLRFYQLGFQCYWWEEVYTLSMAKLPFIEILSQSILIDCNPPLYYLAAHAVMILSGFADIAIRYPSAICGILLIPAMYVLGYVYKNQMTGLFCAGFTAVLFPLVYYSQFGRAYAMSFLFFVIALILYIRIKDGDHSYGTKTLFGIMAGINIWTHLFSLIPIGLLMADLIIEYKKKMIKSIIITAVMCSPFILTALAFLNTRITTAPATGTGQGFGMTLPQVLVMTPTEFFSSLFPYFFLLTVIGDHYDKSPTGRRLLLIALATIGIGLICSLFTPFFPRYYLTVSFIFILISAVACANMMDHFESDRAKIIFLFSIVGFMLIMQNGNFIAHYTAQKYIC